MRAAGLGLGGLLLAVVAVLAGLWWVTFLVGVGLGLLLRPAPAVGAAGLAGAGAWGLPLAVIALQAPLGRAAAVIAGMMGFPALVAAPLVLTVALGLLLGLSGAWLGVAVRGVLGTIRALGADGERGARAASGHPIRRASDRGPG